MSAQDQERIEELSHEAEFLRSQIERTARQRRFCDGMIASWAASLVIFCAWVAPTSHADAGEWDHPVPEAKSVRP